MKTFAFVIISMILAVTMIGCGKLVEVPPGHKGKIFTSGGFQPGVHSPSSIRLPYEHWTEPAILIAEVSDQGKEEKMSIMIPKDNLLLTFDIRGTYSVSDDPTMLDIIFTKLTPTDSKGSVRRIDFDRIYETYAAPVIRTRSREVMTRYKIEYILNNMDAVSIELNAAIQQDLSNTPMIARQLALANVEPPKIIIQAQEAAAAREIAIKQAEADKLVALKKAEAALEVAKKQQQVDLTEAETQVLVDKKLAEGVSEAWLRQRGLAVLERMAQGDNKIIFLPTEALRNPGVMTGIFASELPSKPTAPVVPAAKGTQP